MNSCSNRTIDLKCVLYWRGRPKNLNFFSTDASLRTANIKNLTVYIAINIHRVITKQKKITTVLLWHSSQKYVIKKEWSQQNAWQSAKRILLVKDIWNWKSRQFFPNLLSDHPSLLQVAASDGCRPAKGLIVSHIVDLLDNLFLVIVCRRALQSRLVGLGVVWEVISERVLIEWWVKWWKQSGQSEPVQQNISLIKRWIWLVQSVVCDRMTWEMPHGSSWIKDGNIFQNLLNMFCFNGCFAHGLSFYSFLYVW